MTTTTVPLTPVESLLDKLTEQRDAIEAVSVWLSGHHADLAGFYVHPPSVGIGVYIQAKNAEQMAEAVRLITRGAPLGSVEKNMGDEIASVTRHFGAAIVRVYAMRDAVCERVVTGVETVSVPDPDAPMVTVEREITEWVCEPLLAAEASA